MQQLTKSLGSLTWALPLFGLQQMTNALRRSEDGTLGGDAAAAIDAVTQASLEQCGTSVRETFEAGDKIQREIVDIMCRLVSTGGSDMPGSSMRWSSPPGTSGMSDMMNPMNMVRRWSGRPDDSAQAQAHAPAAHSQQPHESELGWGPVPPIN